MRCIVTGCVGVALGLAAIGQAHEPMSSVSSASQPAVTLGPPTVALGAPRAVPTPRADASVAPCGFGLIARGKADDKSPMPTGPAVTPPANNTNQLPPPTPLSPSIPGATGPIMTGPMPMMGGPITSGPVASGPIMPGAPVMGAPNWAPLPGSSFGPGQCSPMLYGSFEYLYWTIQDSTLPPLLTASPPAAAGAVAPGTVVLFGNDSITDQGRSGGRFTAGWWRDPCQSWGLIGSFFFLAEQQRDFAVSGNGQTVLARPFFVPNGAGGLTPDREIIARPGEANGSFIAQASNSLWGADLNLRKPLCCGCGSRLDGIIGFRYLRFQEDLDMVETFNAFAGANAGRSGILTDSFSTTNDFYGGQVGVIGELRRGCWTLGTTAKVAIGGTTQSVTAVGAQVGVNENGQRVTGAGLLVQPSNSGTFNRNAFAVVPEVGINLGYQVTPHLKLFVGYDFLYWSNLLRVADQIDPVLDVNSRAFPITQRPGAVRPTVPLQDTSFWAQGVSGGIQLKW